MNKLNHVTFHITNSCNLSCRHCWVGSGRKYIENIKEMSIQKWKEVIKECKDYNVGIIRFTGGEPLVKKGVEELFIYCNKLQIPFQIETNGTLLNEELTILIKQNGVRFATVSLDSVNSDFHDYFRNKKGSFNDAIRAIELLNKHEIDFQIIMCICKENINQIPEMIKFCENYKMNSLKINPVNDNSFMDESITILDIKEHLELNEQIKEYQKNTTLKLVLPMPYAFIPLNELISTKPFGCDICNRLAIMPDGKVSLCGVGVSAPDMIMGDITKSSLSEIWSGSNLIKTINENIPEKLEGICQVCIHKKNCMGYCRAFPILQTNNLFAPFHVCQKAYEANLFPKTRII